MINGAKQSAERLNDEYISVEHLMLALIELPDPTLKSLFNSFHVDKDAYLKSLAAVRGNSRVTTDNPESTYDALKKYGYDLVDRARQNKLDPVIGRDDEIRNVIRILSRKTKNNPVSSANPVLAKPL